MHTLRREGGISSTSLNLTEKKKPWFPPELDRSCRNHLIWFMHWCCCLESLRKLKQTLASNKELHLPKLFAPFKDKRRGWHIGTVREQAILYLNCLGYGHGGKSLIDTKQKKAVKLDWFSAKLDFGQYEHPSKASLQSNEFLIEGILNFFGFNVLTHCNFPPITAKKSKKSEKERLKRLHFIALAVKKVKAIILREIF